MRAAPILLCALLALPALAEPLVEVGQARLDGPPVSLAAYETNGSALSLVLVRQGDRSRLLFVDPAGRALSYIACGAGAVAAGPHGDGLLIADARTDGVFLSRHRRSARQFEKSEEARFPALAAAASPRIVSFASAGAECALFCGAGAELGYQYWSADERISNFLVKPGREFLCAAQQPLDSDRDGKSDWFTFWTGPQLVRLVWTPRSGFEAVQDYPLRMEGNFRPFAAAAADQQIWLAGEGDGVAAVYLLDPEAAPAVRSFKDLVKDPRTARRSPVSGATFGAGSFRAVAIVDAERFAVCGARGGKAYVGIFERDSRMASVAEISFGSAAATHMIANPTGCGWSLAVVTDDNVLHFLKGPGATPLPNRWDPWAGGPSPAPPGPPATPTVEERPAAEGSAVFPHVEVDRRGANTEFFLVYLGARPAEIRIRGCDDAGRQAFAVSIPMRTGQRARISLAQTLLEQRLQSFQGYVVVEGSSSRDLVLEAIVNDNLTLMPHWR